MNIDPFFSHPSLVLSDPPWRADAALARLMSVLSPVSQDRGQKGPAVMIVGGAVRNAVMGEPIKDIDLACVHSPDIVMQQAQAAGFRVIPTGIGHGTVTAVSEGRGYEVTTLRDDIESDGRHAVVAYTDDWISDARRRDFTCNTLLSDFEGRVYDPLGSGIVDAQMRRIRFVGDADTRIREDYLRILRFFRMVAEYGCGDMDPAGLHACARARGGIEGLSRERVTQEMRRLIVSGYSVKVIQAMNDHNILDHIIHIKNDLSQLSRVADLQGKIGRIDDVPRWAALVPDLAAIDRSMIIFKSIEINVLKNIFNVKFEDEWSPHSIRRDAVRIGRYGIDSVLGAALLYAPIDRVPTLFAALTDQDLPTFPLTGDDVMAAGIPAGPVVGRVLSDLKEAWVQSNFSMDINTLRGMIWP